MTFFQFNTDPDLTIKLGLFFKSVQCTVHNVELHQDISSSLGQYMSKYCNGLNLKFSTNAIRAVPNYGIRSPKCIISTKKVVPRTG